MACELARHGAAVRIIDRLQSIVPFARATGVHSRTLEVFQDLGIADEIIEMAAPMRGVRQYAGGELILHVRNDGLDSPFPFSASLEQWKVEQTLEKLLGRLGVSVERETELVEFMEHDRGVHATLRRADGTTKQLQTPWLLGCDGAHSRVRHLKGEHFPGEADPRQYLVADFVLENEAPSDEVLVYLTDHGVLWLFPLPEGRALMAADVRVPPDGAAEAPDLAVVQAVIDERLPGTPRVRDPRWMSWFHIHYRLTPHYRHSRTFLAGDAAHIHSPIGGQGMNTGIQDAYNLAWKLALVTRGLACESLLDSYEIERRAVALDVLATTNALTEKAEGYVTLPPEERKHVYRHLVLPEADRLKVLRHSEELDLDYRSSQICGEYLADAGESQQPGGGPHAGAEAPDAHPLAVGGARHTLFELMRGVRHTLLLLPGLDPGQRSDEDTLKSLAAEISRVYCECIRPCLVLPPDMADTDTGDSAVTIVRDTDGALHRRYGATAGRVYLIRPDGYVGFRSEPPLPGPLLDYLDRLFGAPAAT
jgi:2-polyprenyl-6-methoxyphenol hydroxylase-like FAD-dependent oxidoreductase